MTKAKAAVSSMMYFVILLLSAYLLFVGLLYVAQRSLMYRPGPLLPDVSYTMLDEIEVRRVTSGGLDLVSWYAAPAENKPVIVYFQGNAGTIADRDFKVHPWIDEGYGVWLVGYRGFGGNPGRPSEQGLYQDGWAVIETLRGEGISPEQMVLYGESLGTGVATEIALRLADAGTPVLALILEAPFASMGAAAQDHYPIVPAKLLVKDKFRSDEKIDKVDTRLLIIHGDRDRVVRQAHGKRLFDLAREPKEGFWPEGAAHNNLFDFGTANVVQRFLETK